MGEWEQSILKMIEWIDNNIGDNPTLFDMSRQIGYSPYYCSTQFHAITGMTIRAYIAKRRLYDALVDIHNGSIKLIDIAIQHGYQSHEALTRAFIKAYGYTPSRYRKIHKGTNCPADPFVSLTNRIQKGEIQMVAKVDVRFEYVPAHKYIGVYSETETKQGKMWPGHDCQLTTSIVEEMSDEADPIVTAHTAGWIWKNGKRSYFYGLGVPCNYSGHIPEGFEIKDIPGSYYLVFAHPPFVYPNENMEVMQLVENMAWNFDPSSLGYEWNEEVCQDYQCHYPEGLGYQILRPVTKK